MKGETMALPKTVQQYLQTNNIPFEAVEHKIVFTAYDLAATLKEKLESIGKTLLIKADNGFVLVLLPANRRLDLAKLKNALGAKKLSIVSEKEMIAKFKVKTGGLTSFGTLHKVEVFVDSALLKASKVLVAAGSFTDHIRLKARDFVKLENAKTGNISSTVTMPKIQPPKKIRKHKKGTKTKSKGKNQKAKSRKKK